VWTKVLNCVDKSVELVDKSGELWAKVLNCVDKSVELLDKSIELCEKKVVNSVGKSAEL